VKFAMTVKLGVRLTARVPLQDGLAQEVASQPLQNAYLSAETAFNEVTRHVMTARKITLDATLPVLEN